MKLDEVAKLAGVSRTTVSYVINNKAKQYRVSEKTVEKVMAIVKQYNYQPNAVAASLRAGRSRSIGIIIPDLENLSYTRIANYLEQQARKVGYQLLISCSEDNPIIEQSCVEHLKHRRVDAIIVASAMISPSKLYQNWDNHKLPILALDRILDPKRFRNITGADFDDSKRLASEFSHSVNQNIVYLGAAQQLSVSELREQGFRSGISQNKEMASKNISYLYAKEYSRESANKIFTDWLNNNTMPDSLFITSFTLFQGAIDAILAKYGSLPPDLLIATFGDNELLDFLPCRIITLSQNHQQIAETALHIILNYLAEPTSYQAGINYINRQFNYRGIHSHY